MGYIMEANRTECAVVWSGGKRKADDITLPSCHCPQCEWQIRSFRESRFLTQSRKGIEDTECRGGDGVSERGRYYPMREGDV